MVWSTFWLSFGTHSEQWFGVHIFSQHFGTHSKFYGLVNSKLAVLAVLKNHSESGRGNRTQL